METERLEKILRQWLPGEEPIIIEEIHSGISSHARKIMCGKTQGIFREIAVRSRVQDHPGQHGETPSLLKIQN